MSTINQELRADMLAKGVDPDLTLAILDDYNAGLYDGVKPLRALGVPAIDGLSVIARGSTRGSGSAASISLPAQEAATRLAALGLAMPRGVERSGAALCFSHAALEEIGLALLPKTAFGVLNGGSATSYADRKKNLAFGAEVLAALQPAFDAAALLCEGRPKGLCPAFINPDGSPGPSFLLLKLRARLLLALKYIERFGPSQAPILPLFQMSSIGNDAQLGAAYEAYAADPLLAAPASASAQEPSGFLTGVQPLIAAYTHSEAGRPKAVFDRAWGKANSVLALPGGHGQCFRVLAPTLRKLHSEGLRFAWLGNVDNIGYLPDLQETAILALSGAAAAFEFSRRTRVDVKGGILVATENGGRSIADIGPAISFEEVAELEKNGASILFNCATGIFDLDWLVPRLDAISRELPVRFTDQDKDAGRYSQAEQVTWEIAGMIPGFLGFAVDKYERFIAAKLLAETLLTSGVGAGDPRLAAGGNAGLSEVSAELAAGLSRSLAGPCGLVLKNGRWSTL